MKKDTVRKKLVRIDRVFLAIWALAGTVLALVDLPKRVMDKLLFLFVLLLLADGIVVGLSGIYKPSRDHLREGALRGLLICVPIIVFVILGEI